MIMKIGIIGATGKVGLALTKEALKQGYQVVAITRNPKHMPMLTKDGRLVIRKGDLTNKSSIKNVIFDIDILINAYGPSGDNDAAIHEQVAKNLVSIMEQCPHIKRLLIVGGTGSLRNEQEELLINTSFFPAKWKEHAWQQVLALEIYRQSNINWTYFSPAIEIYEEELLIPMAKIKIDNNHVIVNSNGESRISYHNVALIMINEIKNHKFNNKRFTAADIN